jgi:hypothetical protein
MPTNYPNGDNGGIDIFSEPSSPEFTSLSSAGEGGSNTRNHVAHHRDLGDAVEALQVHAARRQHDHSGDTSDPTKGTKLLAAHTHEGLSFAAGATIHHTLGSAANQAAPGNHNHDYNTLTNIPWRVYATKPTTATDGTLVYETGTNAFWVRRSSAWVLLPIGNKPICRLLQTSSQTIDKTNGSLITWGSVQEDTFGYFSSGSPSVIAVSVSGLYHVHAALQWDTAWTPDEAYAIVMLANQESTLRGQAFIRGNGIQPGFSQTLEVSGYLRVSTPGTVIGLKAKCGPVNLVNQITSFFDGPSKAQSRIDVVYVSP